MIDEKKSLQHLVFDLMETGKTNQLTRLWSTAPEDICILDKKDRPVYPMLFLEDETMTLAEVVEQIKIRSQRLTVVAAASVDEKHVVSVELYSQLLIEHHAQVILYLDASDTLDQTEEKRQRIASVVNKCKNSEKCGESTLVVVEDCGTNTRKFLQDFLQSLLSYEGDAVIVTVQRNSFDEIIAELKEMVRTKYNIIALTTEFETYKLN